MNRELSIVNPFLSPVWKIEGYLENSFISFTKDYPTFFQLDEDGNETRVRSTSKPLLTYMGHYDWLNKTFACTWEILMDDELNVGGDMIIVGANKKISS